MNTTEYAQTTGLTQSQARMRLESMVASGHAARHTYPHRPTQFMLLDPPAPEPIRLIHTDAQSHPELRTVSPEELTRQQQRKSVLDLLNKSKDWIPTFVIKRALEHRNMQFTSALLHEMLRGGLVEQDYRQHQVFWRVAK